MKDQITVFICESEAVKKEILERFFTHGSITYAATFDQADREKITSALDSIQES